jgi:hypothetical protein
LSFDAAPDVASEVNLVKDGWFVCVFCDADLPAEWNVAPRRTIQLSGGA